MLANHFGTLAEGNEENSTFFTIPVDFIRDSNGQPSMADLQDLFIGQMPDGTYCLLNNASEEVCLLFQNLSVTIYCKIWSKGEFMQAT